MAAFPSSVGPIASAVVISAWLATSLDRSLPSRASTNWCGRRDAVHGSAQGVLPDLTGAFHPDLVAAGSPRARLSLLDLNQCSMWVTTLMGRLLDGTVCAHDLPSEIAATWELRSNAVESRRCRKAYA
jgi:hypothetical protein